MEGHRSKQTRGAFLGTVSLALACILIIIVLNTFFQWISTQESGLQGIIFLAPFILAPMGALGGWIAFVKHRDTLAKWGVLLNLAVFFFLIFYVIAGSAFMGE